MKSETREERQSTELPRPLLVCAEVALFGLLWLAAVLFIALCSVWAALTLMDAPLLRTIAGWEAHLAAWLRVHFAPLPPGLAKFGAIGWAFPVAWASYLWAARRAGGRTLGQWLVAPAAPATLRTASALWRLMIVTLTAGVYQSKAPFTPHWSWRHFLRSLLAALAAVYLCVALAGTVTLWAGKW